MVVYATDWLLTTVDPNAAQQERRRLDRDVGRVTRRRRRRCGGGQRRLLLRIPARVMVVVEAAKATALHAYRLALFEMHLQPLPSGHELNSDGCCCCWSIRLVCVCWTGWLKRFFRGWRGIGKLSDYAPGSKLMIWLVRWREWFRLLVWFFVSLDNIIMVWSGCLHSCVARMGGLYSGRKAIKVV